MFEEREAVGGPEVNIDLCGGSNVVDDMLCSGENNEGTLLVEAVRRSGAGREIGGSWEKSKGVCWV